MQIKVGLNGVAEEKIRKIVIVWANGTGKAATPEKDKEVCEYIRIVIRKLHRAKIDSASLVPKKFIKIIDTTNQPNL